MPTAIKSPLYTVLQSGLPSNLSFVLLATHNAAPGAVLNAVVKVSLNVASNNSPMCAL